MTQDLQQIHDYVVEPANPFGVFVRPSGEIQTVDSIAVDTLKELVRRHHLVVLRGFA